ncbi:MAG: bifunctional (p)ppGpp synthetase/guanosine-3',5'-bis(diphosphate) 3'-pyrophosphohydrolase [Candidatus Margulisbacteria bacterium]|jgi:GTP pyrophosphokinase|nr:bifunctional (p)ppGpp synthetase/guanosine-3',5'-bis(diphosphate) 3'-pyrophosphohydrolase [Candidatus Margulisiibacteriota bacterium]
MKELLEKIRSYNPKADLTIVEQAYAFAADVHKEHKRLSGDPYIAHPLAVAHILADLEQDPLTIAAAFLHDTVEDGDVTSEEIAAQFGPDVAKMVEGVTKLSQLSFTSREERQAENFRKMFVAMGEDYRIIVIKLADRLHNMQTLEPLSPAKQRETALETREIFAPLAHRMGMWRLKWQLEDLSFTYLEPEAYAQIRAKVAESRGDREAFINDFIARIRELLQKFQIKAEVNGRAKHFYSIYRKMTDQRLEFEQIYDLTAVRIITDSVKECYNVLGVVHDAWKPIPGRFFDYIAMPKSNGYQSLHTTVVSETGRPVEIQIRTKEMHRIAEYGVAAHWRYKEGVTDKALDQKIAWLRQMLDWQSELKDAKDFMDSLKIDLAAEEVFAFTPKGDVFGLTVGATPLDFAYRVHTQVGHRCVGARVNGKIVPLDAPLNNGDIVEIITGKKDAPSLDWLGLVKTTGARVKIKKWLKEQRGGETEAAPLPVIVKEEPPARKPLAVRPRTKGKSAVKVAGLENVLVKFSRCCYPIPGEEIVGFVTQGRGISVHKANCPNAVRQAGADEKMVKVNWNPDAKQIYPVELEVEAFDRVGIFKDILTKIADAGTNVSAAKVTTKRGSSAVLRLVVDVTDSEHLARVAAEVRKIGDVYNIRRK